MHIQETQIRTKSQVRHPMCHKSQVTSPSSNVSQVTSPSSNVSQVTSPSFNVSCPRARSHIYTYARTHVYTYIYTYMHTYIQTYTHTGDSDSDRMSRFTRPPSASSLNSDSSDRSESHGIMRKFWAWLVGEGIKWDKKKTFRWALQNSRVCAWYNEEVLLNDSSVYVCGTMRSFCRTWCESVLKWRRKRLQS